MEEIYECKDMSISDIISTIEGSPEVKSIPVHPGEAISGDKNEDVVPNEGTTVFDIRYHAHIPNMDQSIKILINVEAQQKFTPGYDLVTRGIYYGARMISAQRGTEFTGSNYDDIKKVYSLWICTDAPAYAQNTITEYKIQQERVFRDFQGKVRYDILNVTFMCLGDTNQTNVPEFLSMLSIALSKHIESETKKKILEENYQIPMTRKLEKEINEMCNLADAIENEALAKGLAQGITQGTIETATANARKFFENGASYELVRASIEALSDEELQKIYDEVIKNKQ